MRRKSPALGLTVQSPSDSFGASMFQSQLKLQVNGAEREIPPETSVRELLALLGFEGKRIAVAVNRNVVPRSTFDTHRLAAGDRVEILEAVGGG
jgi:sulfur carrier protein